MGSPITFGGKGYRWRGKLVRTVVKDDAVFVSMPRKDSVIMCPFPAITHKQYRVTITAYKNSGNGALLVNFFAGKNYDGPHIPLNIKSGTQKSYTIAVDSVTIPDGIPTNFRVWKPNNATGTVFIKDITVVPASGPINIPREPRIPKLDISSKKITQPRVRHRPKKKTKKIDKIISIQESSDMKFKPYKLRKVISTARNVIIRDAEDVPKVSIITPTRDGVELIKKCYDALNKNTCYPNWEWIVGDSYSQDGTVEYLKSLEDTRIKIIERGTTDGSFSSINNELAEFATGQYYLFLNNDTEPQKFWLFEMMFRIYDKQDVGIVGAKLLYPGGSIQHAGISFIPNGPANIGREVLKSFPGGFADYDRELQAVTGACMLIRAEDFNAVGGFDNIYYFCYEDVDLCLKVKYHLGKSIIYASGACVVHDESHTQKRHRTCGERQKTGIEVFKSRWTQKVLVDFIALQKDIRYGMLPPDVSFVTCVNDIKKYRNFTIASLLKNKSNMKYEIIPILNFDNRYSAAQALNIGIDKAKSNIIVMCHQDVLFYEGWIDLLFERIREVERKTAKWGVIGTAGISKRDDTIGVVHNIKGKIQWQSTKRTRVYPVQTLDEHCLVIKKNSGLRFDAETFNGFHFYGPDICLNALNKGMMNYGILCPLVHDSGSSLMSGKKEFMRLLNALANKWRPKFPFIRTPTSVIRRRSVRTFVRFST
jgi:GT2 family glycosyltransferase